MACRFAFECGRVVEGRERNECRCDGGQYGSVGYMVVSRTNQTASPYQPTMNPIDDSGDGTTVFQVLETPGPGRDSNRERSSIAYEMLRPLKSIFPTTTSSSLTSRPPIAVDKKSLLREMETHLELESHLCEETRVEQEAQFDDLHARLQHYTAWIASTADHAAHPNWNVIHDMVHVQLPKVLAHLEVKIAANQAKTRQIRHQLDAMRAKRHALQDQILLTTTTESRIA
ncbi:hypothetical protein AC1031_017627 [Aphanomyces cochlioides]|nr:hypothetical protein AC1031_017627 [Aphanomyces cochlioides]